MSNGGFRQDGHQVCLRSFYFLFRVGDIPLYFQNTKMSFLTAHSDQFQRETQKND